MEQIQWLLIGGEGHGETLWIKAGNAVVYPIKDSLENQQYLGSDYLHEGKLYRVGRHNPTPEETARIPALIVETKLAPFGEVDSPTRSLGNW